MPDAISPTDEALLAVRFREAVPDDLPAILRLLADDPLGKFREHVPEGADIPSAYREAFAAIEADPRNHIIVVEAGGAVHGVLQLTFIPGLTYTGRERALIEGVRVSADMRGKGMGRAMLDHVIGLARQRGCALVQLTTDKRRPEALAFYRALGFADSHEGMKLKL